MLSMVLRGGHMIEGLFTIV